mgnify:CR=1 FL=1
MKAQYKEIEEKMNKTLDALYREFGTIRAGKASPSVLDRVTVDYYGAATPIQQLATISTTDARTLVIQPWDKSTLKLINKAIQASDVGINPTDDGSVIQLQQKSAVKSCASRFPKRARVQRFPSAISVVTLWTNSKHRRRQTSCLRTT